VSHYLWLDFETTGLNPHNHAILEIAAVVTTDELHEVDRFEARIRPQIPYTSWETWPQQTHSKSGLVEACKREGILLEDAGKILHAMIDLWWGKEKAVIAGLNPHFDRGFCEVHLPEVYPRLHYRMLDLSSFRLTMGLWPSKPPCQHRALTDVLDEIKELRYYLHRAKDSWRTRVRNWITNLFYP
jgi:oligoribonuclease